jgi:hypothetical protein
MQSKFWSENPKERDHSEDLEEYGGIIEEKLRETEREGWSGINWLGIGIRL